MLRLPRLQYLRPRSIAEATELAAQNPRAMFIAGGTDLVPNLKRRQFDVTTLISLNALPDGRRVEGDVQHGVTIGAGATLDELAHHDLLAGPGLRGGLDTPGALHGHDGGQPAGRSSLQLLQPDVFMAEGGRLLHEEGRRHLPRGA